MLNEQQGFETDPDFLPKFSRHLAHQLNNPIGAISSCAYLLEDFIASSTTGTLSVEDVRPFITSIREECESMKLLVQEFSKFFATTGILTSPIELNEFLAHRVDEMQRGGLPVTMVETERRRTIEGDAGAVQSVIRILVEDAIREGATTVAIELGSEEWPEITIRDNRVKDVSPDAWTTQVEGFAPRHGGGVGLKLPLVGKLVRLHRGSIEASSADPTGLIVRIRLPGMATA